MPVNTHLNTAHVLLARQQSTNNQRSLGIKVLNKFYGHLFELHSDIKARAETFQLLTVGLVQHFKFAFVQLKINEY